MRDSTKPDHAGHFAQAAREYLDWADNSRESGASAARRLLSMLINLYAQGINLPLGIPLKTIVVNTRRKEEFARVYRKGRRLPIGYYGEVFNPLTVPPEEPVVGDLSDDLADIYFELRAGLDLYENKQPQEALWTWKFGLEIHWGEHATSAIRVLHCWLTKHHELSAISMEGPRRAPASRKSTQQKKVKRKPKFRGR